MRHWHCLSLGDLLTAQVELDRICTEFARTVVDRSEPAAVFTRRTAGELHCEVTAYFSPGAADLARQFGAVSCAQPGRRGLELLAGQESSWSLLAP